MKVTIKSIAETAGVHRSTVDKVLHNRIGVSEEVRVKVQKIIDESGYKPNLLGRALQRQQKTTIISAILLEVDALEFIKMGIVAALEEFKAFNIEIKYHIVKMHNGDLQAEIINQCVDNQVDGILLLPISQDSVRKALGRAEEKGIPVVTVNSDIMGVNRICTIGQNVWKAGRVAGRLMGEISQQQGKLAMVTNSKNYAVTRRCDGFIDVVKTKFPDLSIVNIYDTEEDPEITYKGALKMLKSHPEITGLYIAGGCVKDVCQAVVDLNREDKIKIICFEDYEEILSLIDQEIVKLTLTSDLQNQGYMGIKVLYDLLIFERYPSQSFIETDIKILLKESI